MGVAVLVTTVDVVSVTMVDVVVVIMVGRVVLRRGRGDGDEVGLDEEEFGLADYNQAGWEFGYRQGSFLR